MGWFVPLMIAGGATGLGMQMKGQYEAGKAAESQAKSQNAWNEYNAQVAEREATEAQATAAYEEKKHRKAGERLKARQRVMVGKAGILPEGSPSEIMKETANELEIDALMIRRSGTTGAQRLRSEASLSRMTGRAALLKGRSAKRASYLNVASAGLSGGSSLAYMYS